MKSGRFLTLFVWVYLLFLYLPVILLPLFAFNTGKIIAFPLKGFGFQWFYELAKIEALHTAVWTSLKIAIITSVLATILGMFDSRSYKSDGVGSFYLDNYTRPCAYLRAILNCHS